MNEETNIEINATTEESANESPKLSQSEEKATSLGWKPKEQWIEDGHNEDDWKPAKVFLEHGDMIGKIRSQARELSEASNAIKFLNDKNKQVFEVGYQSALKELRTAKREALAEGDLVKADELDEKIDETKQQLQAVRNAPPVVPKQAVTPDPEHAQWLQRNPWYNEGRMQKFADAIAVEYIQVNNGQVTAADVRDFVEQEVKKEFPQKFEGKKTTAAPSPDGDGRGATGKKSGEGLDSKLAKAKAEMTEEQRGIMKTLLKSTGMTEKKYLELYLS